MQRPPRSGKRFLSMWSVRATGSRFVQEVKSRPMDGREWAMKHGHGAPHGESVPVDVDVGDELSAGLVLHRGPVEVEVTATGDDTRLAGLIEAVHTFRRNRHVCRGHQAVHRDLGPPRALWERRHLVVCGPFRLETHAPAVGCCLPVRVAARSASSARSGACPCCAPWSDRDRWPCHGADGPSGPRAARQNRDPDQRPPDHWRGRVGKGKASRCCAPARWGS